MPVERNALICARGFVARIACRQAELGFVAGNSGHLGVWRMTGELGARNNRVSDLAEEVRERVRRMRNQNRIAMIVGRDVLQCVEILRHQNKLHHILGSGTWNCFREILHRIFQSRNDRLPLIGNSFSLEPF